MSNQNEVCDVLVIGPGAGGMSAEIAAQLSGLRTIVIEKTPAFGGTAARSGGWVWIPLSDAAKREKIDDSLDDVLTYLRSELDSSFDTKMLKVYLKSAPNMLRLFDEHTSVKFELGHRFPGYQL